MDVDAILKELRSKKDKIVQAIASLEELQRGEVQEQDVAAPLNNRGRRGCKSMSAEERRAVAARMKNYWKNRRSQIKAILPNSGAT